MSTESTTEIKVRDASGNVLHTLDLYKNTITLTDDEGKLVTMDLGTPDVHIDAALANYAAGYRQVSGISDRVSPVVPVRNNSDKFFTWDKDDVFQDVQDLIVGPGGAVKEVSPRLSNASYTCVSYGIGSFVPTEIDANADAPLQPYQAAVGRCMNAIKLGRERRVAALVTASASWSGGYTTTLGATAKWDGGSSSNPVQDLLTAVENSLTPVSGIAMSELVWHDFIQNPAVQKYTGFKSAVAPMPDTLLAPAWNGQTRSGTGTSSDQFAALLGLPPIYIGYMKGKTSSGYGYVWGNNVALLFNDPNVPMDGKSISTTYTFRWTAPQAPDGTVVDGFLVRSYYDPRRGARGGRMVVVVHNDAEIMTSVYAGGLVISAHQ